MKPQDKCGVIGAVSRNGYADDIAQHLYIGLCALQHRGHESAGISVSNGTSIKTHKDKGVVGIVFQSDEVASPLAYLNGYAGVGHTRYSTTGESGKKNAQPIQFYFCGQDAAIAHNGNITNTEDLENVIKKRGGSDIIKNITSDTGYIAALIATSPKTTFINAFRETLDLLKGAFSLVALYNNEVFAAKDRNGLRPLCVGYTDRFYVVASETCAIDTMEARFLCEVGPGSMVVIKGSVREPQFSSWSDNAKNRSCAFEGIYLSRPDSLLRNVVRVHEVRKTMGAMLAQEHPIASEEINVVFGVPDSGNAAAIGYAKEIKETHPESILDQGLIRPHQSGRTFLEPVKEKRKEFQRLKHNVIPDVVRCRNIVIVDDSIVRGTTMEYLVKEMKRFGANKVFVLSASPVIQYPCHLGVDLPTRDDFVAKEKTVEEVRQEIGADYLGYLSLNGLKKAYGINGIDPNSFCYGCMTNNYPE